MKKILIVDDVEGWVRFHKTNIEYLGYCDIELDCVNSAISALAKVESNIDEPYNVILTDLQMESNFLPKSAGEWLIEQIKMFPQYNKTKIIVISASSDIEQVAKKYGVNYISKYTLRNSESDVYKKLIE